MVDKKINKTVPYLKKKYLEDVVSSMTERFNYKNVMEVPMLTQISLNMGIGDAKDNPKKLESAIQELTLITGGLLALYTLIPLPKILAQTISRKTLPVF